MNLLTLEEPRALEQAIAALQHGGVVAFPTDTVYGIGASLAHPDALERIFEIKGRDRERSLPVLLASTAEVAKVTRDVDPDLLATGQHILAGAADGCPARARPLPPQVVAEDGTVGVRVPDHSVALILAQRCGGAIAVTSANLSGQPPARRPDEIDPALAENLDLILDGGIARGGQASTVIRLDGATISVIREGAVSAAEIEAAWSQHPVGGSSGDRIGTVHPAARARRGVIGAMGMAKAST